jgi:hypothetical protein
MIRIFMMSGTYVETSTFGKLEAFEAALRIASEENVCVRVVGKIGEDVAIRPAAVAYAVRYPSD